MMIERFVCGDSRNVDEVSNIISETRNTCGLFVEAQQEPLSGRILRISNMNSRCSSHRSFLKPETP